MGFEENVHDHEEDVSEYVVEHILPFLLAGVILWLAFMYIPRFMGAIIMTLPFNYIRNGIIAQNILYLLIAYGGAICMVSILGIDITSLLTGYTIFTSAMGFGLVDTLRDSVYSITMSNKILYKRPVIINTVNGLVLKGQFIDGNYSFMSLHDKENGLVRYIPNSMVGSAIVSYSSDILDTEHVANQ